MSSTILVVDDDRKIVNVVKLYLEKNDYQVLVAYDGVEALEVARLKQPDLVVLDLMLPRISGLDVCRILQAESKMPVVMLTARITEDDKLAGFELGADDYLTKPFSPRELVARVRAVLRRLEEKDEPSKSSEIRRGDLLVDNVRHQAWLKGELLRLTPKEFKLLHTLARQPGRVFTRLDLLEQVFGLDYGGLERTVDAHIMNLRKKIEPNPEQPNFLQTVYGVGYKFSEESGNVS